MIKRIFGKKLSRSRTSRDALVRSQVRSLVENGKMVTTLAKAKVVRIYVEKYFSSATDGSLTARRRMLGRLANDSKTAGRIFDIAQKSGKKGGFVKLTQLPPRRGDATKLARLEIISWFAPEPKEEKVKKVAEKSEKKEEAKLPKTKKVTKTKKTEK